MTTTTGKVLIMAGIIILLFGILIYFFHDKLSWIGNLPGDIRITRPGFSFYMPITSMILLSVLISLLARIWSWLNL
ncbi:DUF2905 domain-containing protein [Daejeonella sp. H1SJ63]|uniref:DUF2905 domain-containing protein n=1 Tax=Daejeonella sp. H1SJ63 TaxID=3034145 RepID=UPI0023EB24BE|nr:DUF2905 domain-containing protein [Daejeonella sp. H1SJ63]